TIPVVMQSHVNQEIFASIRTQTPSHLRLIQILTRTQGLTLILILVQLPHRRLFQTLILILVVGSLCLHHILILIIISL
ncbi:MAG: hypothetical protein L0Y56_06730, partial [Nitrospira sp.]|nr:hypothetical protein [Nitrospira sp.]